MTRCVVSFAGAGRVASSLCLGFYNAGIRIGKVVANTDRSSRSLAGKCNAEWGKKAEFDNGSDIIIAAVPDDILQEVLFEIKCPDDSIIAHTAGSFGLDILPAHIKRKGVLYPLQTFTSGRKISFGNLPFFIEASDPDTRQSLTYLAEILGGKVHYTDSEHRKFIHLAAVFACNFTNHMLTIGKEISLKAGLGFKILEPLILETIAKALDLSPENSQTGPAMRKDHITIKKHLELLSFSPEFQDIYRSITKSITEFHKTRIK